MEEILVLLTFFAAVGTAVAILLVLRHVRWWRKSAESRKGSNSQGHAIRTRSLKERIQQVRSSSSFEWWRRTDDDAVRRGLIVQARRSIRQRAFFQRPQPVTFDITEGTHPWPN